MFANDRNSVTLPDLTPNPGMWWYFFTEMFDHFRPFFLMVFSVRDNANNSSQVLTQTCRCIYSYMLPQCASSSSAYTTCFSSLRNLMIAQA